MVKSETIVINGRRYDIRSGAVVQKTKSNLQKSSANKLNKNNRGGDKLPPTISENDSDRETQSRQQKKTSAHQLAQYKTPHRRQKAKTLLRSVVKKPSLKKNGSPFSSVSLPIRTDQTSNEPERINVSRSDRSERASQILKSNLINKFSDSKNSEQMPDILKIDVKKDRTNIVHKQPPVPEAIARAVLPKNPFDTAVERAHSHEQPPVKLKGLNVSRLPLRIAAAVLLVFIIAGTLIYVEAPRLDVSLAAYKSTVAATMPSWMPTGYSFKTPVSYTTGQVVLSFVSGSSVIQISEQRTNWSSSDLLNNFVILAGQSYRVLNDDAQTVYQFNDGSSTWVKGNVWYQMNSSSLLSSSVTQTIASSS